MLLCFIPIVVYISVFHFFESPPSISSYGYSTFCLFILQFLIVELLNHIVSLYATLKKLPNFFEVLFHFTFPSDSLSFAKRHFDCLFFLIYDHSSLCIVVFIVVLTCISLLTNDVEQLFMLLLIICMPSLMKCPFKSFADFFLLGGSYYFY